MGRLSQKHIVPGPHIKGESTIKYLIMNRRGGRKWDIGPKKWWEVGLAGDALSKMVGGGRSVPQTDGRWDIETPATPPQ